jgi:hypothetical protein
MEEFGGFILVKTAHNKERLEVKVCPIDLDSGFHAGL